MRRVLLMAVLVLGGCKGPGYIDLKLVMGCMNLGPMPSPSCSRLYLDCANRLEVRVYEAGDGKPHDILSTRCVPMSELGSVTTLCDVLARADKTALLSDVPNGKKVMVRLRALFVANPASGCDDDLPGQPEPVLLFDGFSDALMLDGASHEVRLRVSTCGTCSLLPPACVVPPPGLSCPPHPCEPPKIPASFPGGTCCTVHCKTCDDPPGTGCHLPPPGCDGGTCEEPVCPPGVRPLRPPGACCAMCAPPTPAQG